MTYTVACPNCGHKAPWTPDQGAGPLTCVMCMKFDEKNIPTWWVAFKVKLGGKS